VVILYEKLNEQDHYIEHENAVSSLAVSHSSLVASGEKGSDPKIHLWDVHTLKTIHIFENDHKSDVYLLEFVRDDNFLISCSLRTNTPVVMYDVNSRTIVFSYVVDELVRQIVPIFTEIQRYGASKDVTHRFTDKNFMLLSKHKAYYIRQNELHSIVGLQNMRRFESLTEINAGVCYVRPFNNPAEKEATSPHSMQRRKTFMSENPVSKDPDTYGDEPSNCRLY
jgi:hypothetical protein